MPTSPNTLGFSKYSQELEAIQRRKKLAELLMQQSMSPMETQQAPGIVVPVSPLQGMAKLVQAYGAGSGMKKGEEEGKALSERYNQDLVSALKSGTTESYLQHPETRGMGVQLESQKQQDILRKKKMAEILSMGTQGAAQGQTPQAGQAQSSPFASMPPQVMALITSGDKEMEALGKSLMEANKGVAQRPGAPVVNPYTGAIIAQPTPSMPAGMQLQMGPRGNQASPVPGYSQGITQQASTPRPDAPMIPVKTSTGQDIQLSQPEYLQWQQSGRLPARLGGQPGGRQGLGVPGMAQSEEDKAKQAISTSAAKEIDQQFAKDYVAFTQGGAQDATKQLSQLQDVITALGEKGANLTGPVVGRTPNAILSMSGTGQKSIAARERVEEVVQRSLRSILGAQFTEKEGERLIARAYNPTLGEKENKIRVQRLFNQLKQALEAKQDASAYFSKNGTLQGWKGKMPTMADFDVAPSKGLSPSEEAELKKLREQFGR